MLKIGQGLSYLSHKNRSKLVSKTCVDKYKKHIGSAQKLLDNHLLCLDTNVLLGFYQLPYEARIKLYNFLEQNKDRIYISEQVRSEFTKNRELVINDYEAKIIVESLGENQKGTQQKILDFLEDNDDVLEAYPHFKEELLGLILESQLIIEKLRENASVKKENCKKQLALLDVFDLLPLFQELSGLEPSEKKFLKDEFYKLRNEAETYIPGDKNISIDTFVYKQPQKIFPGLGDIKKKPNRPYGDYYIFHEIMKWIANKSQEVPIVFLTNDITKGDWLNSNKNPYIHYLEIMYLNTSDIFYILHAEKVFSENLGMAFAHLVTSDDIIQDLDTAFAVQIAKKNIDTITISSLKTLLQEIYPKRKTVEEDDVFWLKVIEELYEDLEIKSFHQLRVDLLENYHLLVKKELLDFCIYDQIDAMQITLDIIYQ
ncbi:MAG: PIN domain-containing protein [Saprospiraceae bacterium]|nr:PIN domain-containing protein [Saprospiraceae bacterium]